MGEDGGGGRCTGEGCVWIVILKMSPMIDRSGVPEHRISTLLANNQTTIGQLRSWIKPRKRASEESWKRKGKKFSGKKEGGNRMEKEARIGPERVKVPQPFWQKHCLLKSIEFNDRAVRFHCASGWHVRLLHALLNQLHWLHNFNASRIFFVHIFKNYLFLLYSFNEFRNRRTRYHTKNSHVRLNQFILTLLGKIVPVWCQVSKIQK